MICPRGTYAPYLNWYCYNCPQGFTAKQSVNDHYWSTTYRTTRDEACEACPDGRTSLGGGSTCTDCAPGKYSKYDHYDQKCHECPVGRYADSYGSTHVYWWPAVAGRGMSWDERATHPAEGCIPCPGGTYQDETGQVSCKSCSLDGSGHFSTETSGLERADQCVCELGYTGLNCDIDSCPVTHVSSSLGNIILMASPLTRDALGSRASADPVTLTANTRNALQECDLDSNNQISVRRSGVRAIRRSERRARENRPSGARSLGRRGPRDVRRLSFVRS